MVIREELVVSAVTFLQDPSVSASSIENRIAFLQSKNLTQEEIDAALARAGGEGPAGYSIYAPQQQQVSRHVPSPYGGGYQQYPWQPPTPPEVPKRDWRDWFIMATVMGGVGYGLYFVAKRYVVPLIAPPTPPQLEQDKQSIDESFEKAFALLDQLAKDTEALKSSEAERTTRLDGALTEVETVIGDLKQASRRREEEARRISDEVRALKDLIPRAMDSQKENTDSRLKELNAELKSLKMLMGQRMNPAPTPSPSSTSFSRAPGTTSPTPATNGTSSSAGASSVLEPVTAPKPASVSTANGTEAIASLQGGARTSSPFSAGVPSGRAPIPAWQMAAAKKNTPAPSSAVTESESAAEGSSAIA